MTLINRSNIKSKETLGQFLTPNNIVTNCLSNISLDQDLIIEPSCGNGSFLNQIYNKQVLGIELDKILFDQYNGKHTIVNCNFYDWNALDISNNYKNISSIHFIGNPPFRSPALSLTSHKKEIDRLRKEYNVEGIREEACLFILKTYDIIKKLNVTGKISYILPEAIFKNNSKVFTKFTDFLKSNLYIEHIQEIKGFPEVNRKLVFISWSTQPNSKKNKQFENYYGVDDEIIPFQKIFKKTYLGSVPCESIFLSCKDESLELFSKRLIKLFSSNIDKSNIIEKLSYNGKPHLKSLQKTPPDNDTILRILAYIEEIKNLPDFSISLFKDNNNYKIIQHRNEERFYFRHNFLKRGHFVYQLNPNPCKSFYFPGNPSSTSPDYFGYCSYDVNRNSCPGALRTVPIKNIANNITDEFLQYWKKNTDRPIEDIFDYIMEIAKTDWYKQYKERNHRFYFGVPKKFHKV